MKAFFHHRSNHKYLGRIMNLTILPKILIIVFLILAHQGICLGQPPHPILFVHGFKSDPNTRGAVVHEDQSYIVNNAIENEAVPIQVLVGYGNCVYAIDGSEVDCEPIYEYHLLERVDGYKPDRTEIEGIELGGTFEYFAKKYQALDDTSIPGFQENSTNNYLEVFNAVDPLGPITGNGQAQELYDRMREVLVKYSINT